MPNLKSLASAIVWILKKKPPNTPLAVRYYSTELAPDMEEEEEAPNLGAHLVQVHAHPFFCVWLCDGPGQTPAARQSWSH